MPIDRTLRAVVDENGNILKSTEGLTCIRRSKGKYLITFPSDRTESLYIVQVTPILTLLGFVISGNSAEATIRSVIIDMRNKNNAVHDAGFHVTITEIILPERTGGAREPEV